jgi:hypothetical protein
VEGAQGEVIELDTQAPSGSSDHYEGWLRAVESIAGRLAHIADPRRLSSAVFGSLRARWRARNDGRVPGLVSTAPGRGACCRTSSRG